MGKSFKMPVMTAEKKKSLDWVLTLFSDSLLLLLFQYYFGSSVVSRDNRCRNFQLRGIKKVCLHYQRKKKTI